MKKKSKYSNEEIIHASDTTKKEFEDSFGDKDILLMYLCSQKPLYSQESFYSSKFTHDFNIKYVRWTNESEWGCGFIHDFTT